MNGWWAVYGCGCGNGGGDVRFADEKVRKDAYLLLATGEDGGGQGD